MAQYLIGIAVDVSASMKQSMALEASDLNRLDLVTGVVGRLHEFVGDQNRSSSRVFVYCFGLQHEPYVIDMLGFVDIANKLLSDDNIRKVAQATIQEALDELRTRLSLIEKCLRRKFIPEEIPLGNVLEFVEKMKLPDRIRNQIRPHIFNRLKAQVVEAVNDSQPVTLPISSIDSKLLVDSPWLQHSEDIFFGGTPMLQCLYECRNRFYDDAEPDDKEVLIIISDGVPTDAEHNELISKEFDELKEEGVLIACCFVSDEADIEPRRLTEEAGEEWSDGAWLLHDAASEILDFGMIDTGFSYGGWEVQRNAKAFVHVNHPDHLEEFLSLLIRGSSTDSAVS